MARVVVIGAGVGGLAAAARLAATGHRVSIVEQSDRVGGKLGRFERDGFTFDTGPGLLTMPQVFADLFAATGSALAEQVDLVRLDPVVRHVFADGSQLDSTSDHQEFTRRIADAFGTTAAQQWRRFWRRAQRIWAASWEPVVRSPVDGPADVARLAWRLPDLAAIAPGRTLRGLTRAYLDDPRLRQLLERYATYTGSDPRRAPAALAAIPYAELTFGGWYVHGGLARLADAVLRRCTAMGVRVMLETRAVRIVTSGGCVTAVDLADGIRLPADVVVANADAAAVYRDLLPSPRQARMHQERSLSGFVLLLGVRGSTPDRAHHTVLFPADTDAEFDAIFGAHQPVEDPTMLVTVADDPTVSPAGHESWFVLVNTPAIGRSPVDWPAYAQHVLDRLAARGLDVRDRIVLRRVRTPADLEAETLSPGGAIYGTPSHRLLRPPQRGTVRGLFLVGGSVHPGGGLPLVALSAEIAARRIGPA
jgi:phytoene desaturase